ncbi:MAG: AEC family transporter [Lachnospiraceae bacterium]|nr:AEC family transporter [Lachnospiraceae bacterium]
MDSFLIAFNAVIPFFVYMFYGFIMRRAGVTDDAFLRKLNKVVFRSFYPMITFWNLYSIDPDMKFRLSFVLYGSGVVIIAICLLLMIVPRFVKDRKKTGVVIQAIYRGNSLIYALPLAQNIYGKKGAILATMAVSVIIPIYNISAVIILEHFSGKASSKKELVKDVATNPLLIGAAAGLLFYFLKIRLPEGMNSAISALNGIATPLALFILGGTLRFSQIGKNRRYLAWGLLFRMVIVPAAVLFITALTPFSAAERFVVFAVFATPVATASYPMAESMGADGELAGQFVVLSTAVSVFTLFLFIFTMGNLGLL